MRKPSRLYLAALLAISLLSACEDPSNVGIGLVGETDTDPQTQVVPIDTFRAIPADTADLSGNMTRFLVGTVNDPMLGTITATGHVDFTTTTTSGTDKFRGGPVTSASLRLRRDYYYGDTTSTQTIRLRTITANWNPSGLTIDSVFAQGPQVMEFTFRTRDTLVVIPLPSTWVAANDTTLRNATFASKFHGFELEPVSGNAVVGFSNRSTFHVVSGGDSLDYVVQLTGATASLTHTTLKRSGSVNAPPGVVVVQRGVGNYAAISIDLNSPVIRDKAINRASIVLTPDRSINSMGVPSGFYRPFLNTLDLRALVKLNGTPTLVEATGTFDSRNRFVLTDPGLGASIQYNLLNNQRYDRMEIQPPNRTGSDFSISVVFLRDLTAPQGKPVAEVTFSPAAL